MGWGWGGERRGGKGREGEGRGGKGKKDEGNARHDKKVLGIHIVADGISAAIATFGELAHYSVGED